MSEISKYIAGRKYGCEEKESKRGSEREGERGEIKTDFSAFINLSY